MYLPHTITYQLVLIIMTVRENKVDSQVQMRYKKVQKRSKVSYFIQGVLIIVFNPDYNWKIISS